MFTRKQYLDNECSHREYYAQFVTQATKSAVLSHLTREQIKTHFQVEQFAEGYQPLEKWDNIPKHCHSKKMKEVGDWLTPAGWVCIAKEAARQIIE